MYDTFQCQNKELHIQKSLIKHNIIEQKKVGYSKRFLLYPHYLLLNEHCRTHIYLYCEMKPYPVEYYVICSYVLSLCRFYVYI